MYYAWCCVLVVVLQDFRPAGLIEANECWHRCLGIHRVSSPPGRRCSDTANRVTPGLLAMIIGMIPMALGLGGGGEQTAPLGRAVIGGLLLATVATLFF